MKYKEVPLIKIGPNIRLKKLIESVQFANNSRKGKKWHIENTYDVKILKLPVYLNYVHKNSIIKSQSRNCDCYLREEIRICCEKHLARTNAICRQNAKFRNVTLDETNIYHRAIKA
jgi:hypothetical protein